MRDLINLVEQYVSEGPGFKSGRIPEFYGKVVQAADEMLGSGDEIQIEDVENYVATHRDLFKKGTITVWRVMAIREDQVMALQPGAELGQHWAHELDDNNFDGFDINSGQHGPDARLFVFEASIETNDVHFPMTVAYNCIFPHENEVFLAMFATPKIIGIYEYGAMEGLSDENLRPDLVGALMKA